MAFHGSGGNISGITSVSAGTYGSANAVPAITVDANGRVSAINTNAITLTAAINANASVGDIGTYGFMQQASGNDTVNPGTNVAGSTLRYSDATGRLNTTTTPSGNWKCMGFDSGAALVNTGTGTGTGTGSGTISGNVQGNTSVQGGKGGTANTNNLPVGGTATINSVTVNSVTVNTEVAYSSTLWLRVS